MASTAGHSIPRLLVPLRAFRLAERRPDDFEKVIVSRAKFVGRKLKPGLSYAISKTGSTKRTPTSDLPVKLLQLGDLAPTARRHRTPHRDGVR